MAESAPMNDLSTERITGVSFRDLGNYDRQHRGKCLFSSCPRCGPSCPAARGGVDQFNVVARAATGALEAAYLETGPTVIFADFSLASQRVYS